MAWRQVLARVRQQALARLDQHGLQMHRLTQAILRGYLPPNQAAETREGAAALLAANHPGDEELPTTWPGWARLLPHLLALDPEASTEALSDLTYDAIWYLIRRGDARSGYDVAYRIYQHRLGKLGPDSLGTLNAAATLAVVLRARGRDSEARELDEDTLARYRRVLGEDHPDTLTFGEQPRRRPARAWVSIRRPASWTRTPWPAAAGCSARTTPTPWPRRTTSPSTWRNLGEHQAARDLDEDTLARRRRVLGEDHPDTLASASNLAADLANLGEHQAARDLDEDTLARRRRVLGEDHPDTLASANNLAADLRALGETETPTG